MSMFTRPYSPENYPDHVAAFEEFVASPEGRRLVEEHLERQFDEVELLPVPPLREPDYRKALGQALQDESFAQLVRKNPSKVAPGTAAALIDLNRRILASYEPVMYSPFDVDGWAELDELVTARFKKSAADSALVSILFTQPKSIVYKDLRRNHAYIDIRSGLRWDLYIAGYEAVPILNRWRFDARGFNELREHVESEHKAALISPHAPAKRPPWHFSGTADLVSVMAYPGGTRTKYDWLSLKGVRLLDSNSRYISHSLGEVVETLSDWRDDTDPAALRALAPGEVYAFAEPTLSLTPYLLAAGSKLVEGVAVNTAYDLLKKLIAG